MPRAPTAREAPAIPRSEHSCRGEAAPVGSVLPHKLYSFVSYSAASDNEHYFASAKLVNVKFETLMYQLLFLLMTACDDIIVVALSRA